MKKFLAFCAISIWLCLWSRAQFNFFDQAFLGQAATQSVTPPADYTNTLYADYESDTTESLGGYVNGNIVVYWTNVAAIKPVSPDWRDLTSSGATWPYFTNNVTPTGQPALDFVKNDGVVGGSMLRWQTGGVSGSNQPNTLIMCILVRSNASQIIMDCYAGAREIVTVNPGGTAFGLFAGSSATINAQIVMSNFFVLTVVMNGANTYLRTNGVLVGTGNPGANAIGALQLGNDITGVTKYTGQLCSYRIYAEALSTNNLHIAEQNVATRYLGITLPSP